MAHPAGMRQMVDHQESYADAVGAPIVWMSNKWKICLTSCLNLRLFADICPGTKSLGTGCGSVIGSNSCNCCLNMRSRHFFARTSAGLVSVSKYFSNPRAYIPSCTMAGTPRGIPLISAEDTDFLSIALSVTEVRVLCSRMMPNGNDGVPG